MNSRIINYMRRAFDQSFLPIYILMSFFKTKLSLFSFLLSNFCLVKQKLQPLKAIQQKLHSRTAKYVSAAYNQASDKIKSDLIFSSFPSKAVSPLISIGNACLIKQQLQPLTVCRGLLIIDPTK